MIENNYSQAPTSGEGPNKKKLFLIISAVVLFVILSGGVFMWLRNGTENQPSNDAQNGENSNTSDANQQPIEDPFPHDKDRDGIADEEEKSLGLSDLQFDTDSDGLTDVDEIEVWKTDPKKFDTDGDGFGDGYEVVNQYDPLGPGKTTP